MIDFNRTKVYNWENAIVGMRHPLESYHKIDSDFENNKIGDNDLNLMKKLCNAGSDHRKFMRQILVSVDIKAPLYWWKEADTYKISTVANSTSSMHTIHKNGIEDSLFSLEDLMLSLPHSELMVVYDYLNLIEEQRVKFNNTKDKSHWRNVIQLLPSSLNQTRMMTMNYEVIRNMYHGRENHKLSEWRIGFVKWVNTLPYAKELIIGE